MNERDFFNEQQEAKRATYSCPHCRERADYEVRWLRRTKKRDLPRGASEQDRARFQKSRDYMVRVDDTLDCKKCRRRFDIRTRSRSSSSDANLIEYRLIIEGGTKSYGRIDQAGHGTHRHHRNTSPHRD
jgi:uncharacterized protein YlaI